MSTAPRPLIQTACNPWCRWLTSISSPSNRGRRRHRSSLAGNAASVWPVRWQLHRQLSGGTFDSSHECRLDRATATWHGLDVEAASCQVPQPSTSTLRVSNPGGRAVADCRAFRMRCWRRSVTSSRWRSAVVGACHGAKVCAPASALILARLRAAMRVKPPPRRRPGSRNIATEGRDRLQPAQLDEAVRTFIEQHDYEQTVVIVDATFGHRIDPERGAGLAEEAIPQRRARHAAGRATIRPGQRLSSSRSLARSTPTSSPTTASRSARRAPVAVRARRLWGGKPKVLPLGWRCSSPGRPCAASPAARSCRPPRRRRRRRRPPTIRRAGAHDRSGPGRGHHLPARQRRARRPQPAHRTGAIGAAARSRRPPATPSPRPGAAGVGAGVAVRAAGGGGAATT